MKQASKLSGVELSTLKHLNAGYLSDSLQSNKPRGLLVPIENAQRFEQAIGLNGAPESRTDSVLSAAAAAGSDKTQKN